MRVVARAAVVMAAATAVVMVVDTVVDCGHTRTQAKTQEVST